MQYVLQKNKAQNTNNSDSVRKAERILRLAVKTFRSGMVNLFIWTFLYTNAQGIKAAVKF